MRYLLIAALFFFCSVALGESQQKKKAENHDATTNTHQQGSSTDPFFVKIIPPKDDNARAQQEEKERNAKIKADADLANFTGNLASYTSDLAKYTAALIAVGVIQILIFIGQLIFIWRQESATKTIERAYVKMSHDPPGLNFEKPIGAFWLRSNIKNYGRTPARISDVLITFKILPSSDSLPRIPEYQKLPGSRESPKAFLVTEDEFFISALFDMKPVDPVDIDAGVMKLWVYGYVDYIDNFKQRHRAGYARVYQHQADDPSIYAGDEMFKKRSNLVFVTQAGYNYDRPRKKDEGNDWDE
jgi:hypothetical protein